MKNKTPFLLCIIGGLLLIITGYVQGVSTIILVYQLVHTIGALAPYYLIIDTILLVLWFIAWSGGFAVILGGWLLTTSHVTIGKFIIAIASGFGLISLILTIIYVWISFGLVGLLVLTWLMVNSLWAIGLIMTIIARGKAD